MRLLLLLLFALITSVTSFGQHLFNPSTFSNREFAHRAGYAVGLENTIQTLLVYLEKGHRSFELDISMTSDGTIILFHDETISRVLATEVSTPVAQMSWSELSKIHFRSENITPAYVNSLDQLILKLNSIENIDLTDLLIELDFKINGTHTALALKKTVEIISKLTVKEGDSPLSHFFISTFYPAVLKALNQEELGINYAFAINNDAQTNRFKAKLGVLFAPLLMKKYNVNIIEPNIGLVSHRFVKKWRKKGKLINTYTANSYCQKTFLAQFDIAITSNCPDTSCLSNKTDEVGDSGDWFKYSKNQCLNSAE